MGLTKSKKNKGENKPKFIYIKSVGISILFALVLFLIVAILITYTSIPESILPVISSIIITLSIALSGLLAAFAKEEKGFIHGLITGIIYTVIVLFVSWIVVDGFTIHKYTLLKGLIGILTGGIGGMIGVNLK